MFKTLCILLALGSGLLAGEETKNWSNEIDLSGSWSSGNTKSNDIRLGNSFELKKDKSSFTLDFDVARVETFAKTAAGPPPYEVSHATSTVSEENYKLAMGYRRSISTRLNWLVDGSWEKDKVVGIDSRTVLSVGLGNTWVDTEQRKFTTDYLATLVDEQRVVEAAGVDGSYPAISFHMDHHETVTSASKYKQKFILDFNTDDTDDYQIDWKHEFAVSVSTRIALKLELELNYKNVPALAELALYGGSPAVPTGATVIIPLEDLDTIFLVTMSLKL